HIGGDDFVVLLRSRDWSIRLLSLLEDLQISLVNFHSPQDRETGHMVARGRDGATAVFPLLSVSIAAVEVKVAPGMTLDSVAESLRRPKAAAKARPGCSCMLSTDERIVDLLAEPASATPQSNDTVMLPALGFQLPG